MPYYLIVNAEVTDPAQYARYRDMAGPIVQAYGGRYLVRGGETKVFEGAPPGGRIVLLEFPTKAQAEAFYSSPEYTRARQVRQGAASMNMLGVQGV